MEKIELEIVALSHSITQSHSYAVVLGEVNGKRRLPIVIGGFEAQAIAVALEKMTPSRPLTHDLVKNLYTTFNIELKEVIINNLLDGIFYAQLVCESNGQTVEIDSRTSDALALAVRFDCPIYSYEFIMDSAGIILEESGKEGEMEEAAEETGEEKKSPKAKKGAPGKKADLSKMSLQELHEHLEAVLNKEDYEAAIRIRDEITRRKESS